jgi:hypothetical protein
VKAEIWIYLYISALMRVNMGVVPVPGLSIVSALLRVKQSVVSIFSATWRVTVAVLATNLSVYSKAQSVPRRIGG